MKKSSMSLKPKKAKSKVNGTTYRSSTRLKGKNMGGSITKKCGMGRKKG